MLPASRAITVSRTSKAMRTAVKKADAIVPLCGRETKTSSLCYACYTSKTAALWSTEAVSMVEATANFLSASLVELDLQRNDIGAGGGQALAEALRLNTTVTSLNLHRNRLVEGAGRALAQARRLNTTLA